MMRSHCKSVTILAVLLLAISFSAHADWANFCKCKVREWKPPRDVWAGGRQSAGRSLKRPGNIRCWKVRTWLDLDRYGDEEAYDASKGTHVENFLALYQDSHYLNFDGVVEFWESKRWMHRKTKIIDMKFDKRLTSTYFRRDKKSFHRTLRYTFGADSISIDDHSFDGVFFRAKFCINLRNKKRLKDLDIDFYPHCNPHLID